MPLLRSEKGIVYTSISEINVRINPCEVGVFKINPIMNELSNKPLTSTEKSELYDYVPSELDSYFKQKKLSPSVVLPYWSGSDTNIQERILRSLSPHTNSPGNNEAHIIISGAIILYIDNGNGQYAILLQPGEWIYIDGCSEAWPKLTFEKYFTLVSYHSAPLSPIDIFHKDLKFTKTKMKSIL